MNMITYGLSVLVLVVKVREWICMNKDCVSSVFSLLLDSFSDVYIRHLCNAQEERPICNVDMGHSGALLPSMASALSS